MSYLGMGLKVTWSDLTLCEDKISGYFLCTSHSSDWCHELCKGGVYNTVRR